MTEAKCKFMTTQKQRDFLLTPFLKNTEVLDDYREVQPFPPSPAKHSFISEERVGNGFKIKYFQKKSDDSFLISRAYFGPETEGPPGFCHGGSQAALLDEVMGAAAWIQGKTVLAAKIEVQFRKSLPVGSLVSAIARIQKQEGKKIFIEAQLRGDDDVLYAESTGLFVEIDVQKHLKKEPRPSNS